MRYRERLPELVPAVATSRHALVFLCDGRSFDGQMRVEDGFVYLVGRERVRHLDELLDRPVGEWIWPRQQLREIRLFEPGPRQAS